MNFDVIIIGAGPAGITLASHLSEQYKIAIIEKGDYHYSTEINTNDYGVCSDYGNYPFQNYSTNFSSLNNIGGNSIIWSGWCLPLEKDEVKNWPINYGELEKYYEITSKFLNLKSFNKLKDQKKNQYNKFSDSDWKINSWQFMRKRNFKNFTKKFKSNIKIFSNTKFDRFQVNEKKIEGIFATTKDKDKINIKSKLIIIAQGALQSTRTLMVSEKTLGIKMGNENGHLGKFYMEHPHINLGFFYDKQNILNKTFDKINFERNGLFLKKPYQEDILNGCITFDNESLLLNQDAMRLLYILRVKKIPKNIFKNYSKFKFILNLIKGSNKFLFEKLLSKKFIYARFEQKPNIHSAIELDEKNNIKLNWKISNEDIKSFCKITQLIESYVKKNITNNTFIDHAIFNLEDWEKNFKHNVLGIGHHMGTTMMSNTKGFGVVNENLQLHNHKNIFVCSSSVFPTGGVAHPTFTICALSIRLAKYIEKVLS